MKTLQIFFGVGAAVALFASVAVAEIRNESMQPLRFSVDTGDGSITLPDFIFCDVSSVGGEESQATCMMTPGGNMPNTLLELPVVPHPTPADAEDYTSAGEAIAPVAQINSPQPPAAYNPYNPRRPGSPAPNDDSVEDPADQIDPPPTEVVTPEPATLVIVGLGIVGGAIIARRRRQG